MEQRIRDFEQMWDSRLQPPAQLVRFEFADIPIFPRPALVRQTNRHELLPAEMRERWWNADSGEIRDSIMMEYEAMEWGC